MNNKHSLVSDTETIDQKLTTILLDELDGIFRLFQDGIVNDDTFVGGLPMSYLNADGSLGALTLEESQQIRQALMDPVTQSGRRFGLSLLSLIDWLPFIKGQDSEEKIESRDPKPSQAIIDNEGRPAHLDKDENQVSFIECRLKAQGLNHLCAYWYSINEKIEGKRREEACGDLALIEKNRRRLNAKRLNATPFEQAAQKFSANIASQFCDAAGSINSPDSLREFIHRIVEDLLRRTKAYWSVAPLLSLFDGIVAPVLRPMLFPHQTWASEHNFFSEDGAFDVGQLANKRTLLETTPIWNGSARQQALEFVEQAFRHHLSSRLWSLHIFDTFSPYNREIHHSEHMDPTTFNGKTKSFGPPVHPQDAMQLIQPIPKRTEEKVLEKVMTYRSSAEGVWH